MLRIFRKNQPLIQNHNEWRMHQNPQHSRQEGNGCARIIYQKWWCKRCRKKSTGKCHGKSQQGHSSRSVKNAESKYEQEAPTITMRKSLNYHRLQKKILLLRISTNTQLQKQWRMEPIYLQRISPSISQIPQKSIVSPFSPHNLSIPAPKTLHSSPQHRKKHKRAYNDISATKK